MAILSSKTETFFMNFFPTFGRKSIDVGGKISSYIMDSKSPFFVQYSLKNWMDVPDSWNVYTVKKVSEFPSPAGMSLTKLFLAGNLFYSVL
jgi:hypothetical protein